MTKNKEDTINPKSLRRKKRFLETRNKIQEHELEQKIQELQNKLLNTKKPTKWQKIEEKLERYFESIFIFKKKGK